MDWPLKDIAFNEDDFNVFLYAKRKSKTVRRYLGDEVCFNARVVLLIKALNSSRNLRNAGFQRKQTGLDGSKR